MSYILVGYLIFRFGSRWKQIKRRSLLKACRNLKNLNNAWLGKTHFSFLPIHQILKGDRLVAFNQLNAFGGFHLLVGAVGQELAERLERDTLFRTSLNWKRSPFERKENCKNKLNQNILLAFRAMN